MQEEVTSLESILIFLLFLISRKAHRIVTVMASFTNQKTVVKSTDAVHNKELNSTKRLPPEVQLKIVHMLPFYPIVTY